MSASDKASVGYVTIWVYLVVLVAASVAVLAAPVSKPVAVILIFSVALIKAMLVIRNYMHVRKQPLMIYAMLTIPVLLAIALTLTLLPDIGFRH